MQVAQSKSDMNTLSVQVSRRKYRDIQGTAKSGHKLQRRDVFDRIFVFHQAVCQLVKTKLRKWRYDVQSAIHDSVRRVINDCWGKIGNFAHHREKQAKNRIALEGS